MKESLSYMRSEVAGRDAVTPFVCSTFKDFVKERNHLAGVVFPRLRGFYNFGVHGFYRKQLVGHLAPLFHKTDHLQIYIFKTIFFSKHN